MLQNDDSKEINMLRWSVAFLITAMIAGFLGFSEIMGTATEVIKFVFIVSIVLFVISGLYRESTV